MTGSQSKAAAAAPPPAAPEAIPPAPGGTLDAFAEYYRQAHEPCALSDDGRAVWAPTMAGGLERFPLDYSALAGPGEVRRVLAERGIWMAVCLVEPDAARIPNCFNYVCRDRAYDLEKLSPNARRDIRRGLRNFEIRRCSWEEFTACGLPAYADTAARHGEPPPTAEDLAALARRRQGQPFFETWGAWQQGELAAWMDAIKVDDWVLITMACSINRHLAGCPNNALVYQATRRLLVEEGYASISYGISSARFRSDVASLHKFKCKMGYQAEPKHRSFHLHPLLAPVLGWRVSARVWEALATRRPQARMFNQLAGISRLASGWAKDPLAWARGEPK